MKPAFWIIKSNRFNSVLGVNGKFYNMTPIENIKEYKREGNAMRRIRHLQRSIPPEDQPAFTAYALYPGDSLDCCGRIEKHAEQEAKSIMENELCSTK